MSEVVIVTGPAGSGKSTACQAFANTAPGVWAYIGQDEVRDLIHAGFRSPAGEWDDEVRNQWEVSHRISSDMMRRYQQANINCIVDGFSPNLRALYETFPEYLKGINYKLAVIFPSLKECLERNRQREGEARLKDYQIENMHGWYADFIKASGAFVIDSTNLDADAVVESLRKFVLLDSHS